MSYYIYVVWPWIRAPPQLIPLYLLLPDQTHGPVSCSLHSPSCHRAFVQALFCDRNICDIHEGNALKPRLMPLCPLCLVKFLEQRFSTWSVDLHHQHLLGSHGPLRPTKSETLEKVGRRCGGVRLGNLCFSKPSGDSDACYSVRTTC